MDVDLRCRKSRHGAHVRWAEGTLIVVVLLLALHRVVPEDRPGPLPAAEALRHRIDLNRAPWHELVNLPRIGQVRARRIVADREKNGPFLSPRALARVRGIGPATVMEIESYVLGGRE